MIILGTKFKLEKTGVGACMPRSNNKVFTVFLLSFSYKILFQLQDVYVYRIFHP